jgi:hypothetical protein
MKNKLIQMTLLSGMVLTGVLTTTPKIENNNTNLTTNVVNVKGIKNILTVNAEVPSR